MCHIGRSIEYFHYWITEVTSLLLHTYSLPVLVARQPIQQNMTMDNYSKTDMITDPNTVSMSLLHM